jgi:hypothetical protein
MAKQNRKQSMLVGESASEWGSIEASSMIKSITNLQKVSEFGLWSLNDEEHHQLAKG